MICLKRIEGLAVLVVQDELNSIDSFKIELS
jgi:hypothetical protein